MTSLPIFPPPPPSGLNYIPVVQNSLNFVLVLTPLGAVLVPVILVLLFFSSPQSRRHPVFVLNIFSCCTGICIAALGVAVNIIQILYPLDRLPTNVLNAVVCLAIFSPLFIDSILLFRLLAFFPRRLNSKKKIAAVLAFPIIVKCARLVATSYYISSTIKELTQLESIMVVGQNNWYQNPSALIEWSLQVADNM
jgi:hypothetical protein